jgi:hypothetical protein
METEEFIELWTIVLIWTRDMRDLRCEVKVTV